jgi:hypothetical protein
MRLATVCLAGALVALANASGAEDRVQKSDLPALVQKTADAQSAGATGRPARPAVCPLTISLYRRRS